MSGLNRVMIIGNLGRDPELKNAGGTQLLKLNIAVGERYKDKSGEWKDKTEWVNATLWGARADALAKILVKGDKVYVEGSLRTTTSEKDGKKAYFTEVNVSNIILCGGKGGSKEPSEPKASQGKPSFDASAAADDSFASDDLPF